MSFRPLSFLRRRPLPAAVAGVELEPGERRLAWAVTDGGDPVVATDLGLRLPGAPRVPWLDVEKATWNRPRLTVVQVAEVEGTGPTRVLLLEQEGELPEVVRTCVTGSVGWTTHARLSPRGGVRIVGRRQPGRDDLRWQLVYDRGTDPGDPLLREQATVLLEDARRTIG